MMSGNNLKTLEMLRSMINETTPRGSGIQLDGVETKLLLGIIIDLMHSADELKALQKEFAEYKYYMGDIVKNMNEKIKSSPTLVLDKKPVNIANKGVDTNAKNTKSTRA